MPTQRVWQSHKQSLRSTRGRFNGVYIIVLRQCIRTVKNVFRDLKYSGMFGLGGIYKGCPYIGRGRGLTTMRTEIDRERGGV